MLPVQSDTKGEGWHDDRLILQELWPLRSDGRASPDSISEVDHSESASKIQVLGSFIGTLNSQIKAPSRFFVLATGERRSTVIIIGQRWISGSDGVIVGRC